MKFFFENNPSYLSDISSADIDVWIRQKHFEDDVERVLTKMNSEMLPLITPHLSTLLKKRKRMLIKDDYGFIDDKNWQDELDYFLNRAIIPHIKETRLDAAVCERFLRVANNTTDKDEKEDDFLDVELQFVDRYIKLQIDGLLDFSIDDGTLDKNTDISLLDPIEYEHFCADLLKENGWNVQVTKASGDQGIDILAEKDGFLLALQCKKYSSPVGNKAVQEAHSGGTFYEANAFAVVSPVEYTSSARELANSLNVHLFHHDDLATLTITDREKEC